MLDVHSTFVVNKTLAIDDKAELVVGVGNLDCVYVQLRHGERLSLTAHLDREEVQWLIDQLNMGQADVDVMPATRATLVQP